MTKKAYIVANEQQEMAVLEKLEREGIVWVSGREKPTKFTPKSAVFPYILFIDNKGRISWDNIGKLTDEEIIYDGRKEEQISDKYVVSQEFMNELEEWKEDYITDALDEKYHYVSAGDLDTLPGMIKEWWIELNKPTEINNRLIAIIRWVNGEDVFEVEKSKKWVVRSKNNDTKGIYSYVSVVDFDMTFWSLDEANATHFDTKEEAQEWANSHQEVIEVAE